LLKVKEKDFDMTQQAFNAFYATKMNGDELNLDLVDLIQGTANLEYTASTAFDRRAGNMSIKDKIEAFVAQNMDKKNFYLIDCDSVSLALEDSIKMLINVKKEEHVSREELLKRLKELADNGKLNNEFSEKIKKVTELSWDDLVEYVLQSVDQAIVKNSKDGFSTPKQMVAEIRIMNTYEAISDSKKGKGAVDALGIELRDFFATGDAIDWERIRNAEPDKRGIASVGGTVAGVN
jgi:hypothetical protein